MHAKPVDRNVIAVWRWQAAFMTFVLLVGAGVLAWRLPLPAAAGTSLYVLLAAVSIAWAWWYPAARYRRLRYRIDATGIVISDGVVLRVQSAVARVRIQHTDIFQGPLQRHYGVATLKLYTAGSHYTKIELPGLAHADALALRDELQKEGAGDAV